MPLIMLAHKNHLLLIIVFGLLLPACTFEMAPVQRHTMVEIHGEHFFINGKPTYAGRSWTTSDGTEWPIEGLLMNARLVQGIFDDKNELTVGQWSYSDTGSWDPDRNTSEFIEAMASWKAHGLLAFTLNLQGGCPYGYCRDQPWDNSAFNADGSLRPGFMHRLQRILDRADELGMVVILGYFYFGQDNRLLDETAVLNAVDNATQWILEHGYTNVLVEINNECNVRYDHELLTCGQVHTLIDRVRNTVYNGRSLYVSTSLAGGHIPSESIIASSDFVLLHGNGVRDPSRMERMVEQVRAMPQFQKHPKPIINNEDDQPWIANQGWGESGNNMVACVKHVASWGYFDFRQEPEQTDLNQGFQSIPADWHIASERKRAFFNLLAEITGFSATPTLSLSFSGEPGRVEVSVGSLPQGAYWKLFRLLLNNETVHHQDTVPAAVELESVPPSKHIIRAIAVYEHNGKEIAIASAMHQNPWWPYGGPH